MLQSDAFRVAELVEAGMVYNLNPSFLGFKGNDDIYFHHTSNVWWVRTHVNPNKWGIKIRVEASLEDLPKHLSMAELNIVLWNLKLFGG